MASAIINPLWLFLTFDLDLDGVVHSTQLVPGSAAIISSIRLGHVADAQRPLVVEEGGALGREVAAHFAPGDFWGGSVTWEGGGQEGGGGDTEWRKFIILGLTSPNC